MKHSLIFLSIALLGCTNFQEQAESRYEFFLRQAEQDLACVRSKTQTFEGHLNAQGTEAAITGFLKQNINVFAEDLPAKRFIEITIDYYNRGILDTILTNSVVHLDSGKRSRLYRAFPKIKLN